jgi:hypothetical protein
MCKNEILTTKIKPEGGISVNSFMRERNTGMNGLRNRWFFYEKRVLMGDCFAALAMTFRCARNDVWLRFARDDG